MVTRRRTVLLRLALAALGSASGCVQKAPSGSTDASVTAATPALRPASTVAAKIPAPPATATAAPLQGDPEIERACTDICGRTRELKCPNVAECMPNCLAVGTVTPCTQEVTALYKCLVKQPVKNWECAEDGVAAIRDGFCDKEQEKTVTCMEKRLGNN
jgi:hypothetical protein